MTPDERLLAINTLNDWRRDDPDIGLMVATILSHHGLPHVGHLAHHHPDVFDELFEEAEAMRQMDD